MTAKPTPADLRTLLRRKLQRRRSSRRVIVLHREWAEVLRRAGAKEER